MTVECWAGRAASLSPSCFYPVPLGHLWSMEQLWFPQDWERRGFCRIQAQHSRIPGGSSAARGTILSSLPAADSATLLTINLGVKRISTVISQG